MNIFSLERIDRHKKIIALSLYNKLLNVIDSTREEHQAIAATLTDFLLGHCFPEEIDFVIRNNLNDIFEPKTDIDGYCEITGHPYGRIVLSGPQIMELVIPFKLTELILESANLRAKKIICPHCQKENHPEIDIENNCWCSICGKIEKFKINVQP